MIVEIDVPEGKKAFVNYVDDRNEALTIACFASRAPIEYEIDEDGKPTGQEVLTAEERARCTVTAALNKQLVRYQKKQQIEEIDIIDNIIT